MNLFKKLGFLAATGAVFFTTSIYSIEADLQNSIEMNFDMDQLVLNDLMDNLTLEKSGGLQRNQLEKLANAQLDPQFAAALFLLSLTRIPSFDIGALQKLPELRQILLEKAFPALPDIQAALSNIGALININTPWLLLKAQVQNLAEQIADARGADPKRRAHIIKVSERGFAAIAKIRSQQANGLSSELSEESVVQEKQADLVACVFFSLILLLTGNQ